MQPECTLWQNSCYSFKHYKYSFLYMGSYKKLDVKLEDQNKQKWCFPLKEEVFVSLMEKGNPYPTVVLNKIFNEGSLFSPLLFGKFFDPCDAFPIWEFESDVLLSNLGSSRQATVDWFQTDADYVLKAQLPDVGKNIIQVCAEDGKFVEISGQWRPDRKVAGAKDWRYHDWWEHGYVRRIELPQDVDWRNIEACVKDDTNIEIRIPKNNISHNSETI